MECLFCSIVSGKIPAIKVLEDERFLAFLDINPSSTGHTVVIPKKHYPALGDMPKEEVEAIFGFIADLSKSVTSALGTDACNIGINVGKLAGQEIPHVHFHILPRYPKDGGASVQGIVKMPFKKEDLPAIAEKIKAAVGSKPQEAKVEPKKEEKQAPKPEEKKEAKPKREYNPERDWQRFSIKHQEDCDNLAEARNI